MSLRDQPPSPRPASTLACSPPNNNSAAILLSGLVCTGAVILWAVALFAGVHLNAWITPRPAPAWHPRLAAQSPLPSIPLPAALQGRDIFERTCAQCHSSSGLGKQGLGKDLVRSDFVADRSDADLVAFVTKGRPIEDPLNTTKVSMPPKGGFDFLTADDLGAVVTYVRGLQDPRRLPALPTWVPPKIVVTEQDKADALAAAGGDKELAEFIASGSKIFHSVCIACHGPAGIGMKGNGKILQRNEFIQSQDDDHLLAFIQKGRDPGDPKNTTGVAMPPKGGNPALKEDDLLDVIAYLRTLQKVPSPAAPAK